MSETDSRYHSIITPTTPRLVFDYEDDGDGRGKQSMKWGVHGTVPTPLLVAATIRAQLKLCQGHWMEPCPETKLVIAWPSLDPTTESATPIKDYLCVWFLHPHVPTEYLITMLEVAKSMMLASMIMHQQQEKSTQGRVQAYKSDGSAIN